MAAFLWLSVISRELYITFNTDSFLANFFLTNHRFLTRNIYAWSVALAFTGVTYLANEIVEDEDWNPRVGSGGQCWIYSGFLFEIHLWSSDTYLLSSHSSRLVCHGLLLWSDALDSCFQYNYVYPYG